MGIRKRESPPELFNAQALKEQVRGHIGLQTEKPGAFDARATLNDLFAVLPHRRNGGNGTAAVAKEGENGTAAEAKDGGNGKAHDVFFDAEKPNGGNGKAEKHNGYNLEAQKASESADQLPLYRILRDAMRGTDIFEQMNRISELLEEHSHADTIFHSEEDSGRVGKFLREARVLLLLRADRQLGDLIGKLDDGKMASLNADISTIMADLNAESRLGDVLSENNPSSALAAPIHSRISAIRLSIRNEQEIHKKKAADPTSWSDTSPHCEPGHFEPSYGMGKESKPTKATD